MRDITSQKARLAAVLTVLLLVAGCGRRAVVDPEGNVVDTARTRIMLALSDFGTAFIGYGDLVIEMRDAGQLAPDVANQLIALNINVVNAADIAVGVVRNSGDDESLLDALETTSSAFGDVAALVPDGRLDAALLAAQNYLVLAVSIARANF
jgi:hypothetical protein